MFFSCRVDNGELVLPTREDLIEYFHKQDPKVTVKIEHMKLYVNNNNSFWRVGERTLRAGFDYAHFNCCNELRVVDVPMCTDISIIRCAKLCGLRANVTGSLNVHNCPNLTRIDVLGASRWIGIRECNALAVLRGAEHTIEFDITAGGHFHSVPLYILGDRFDRLMYAPSVFLCDVFACPLIDLWSNESRVPGWYTEARKRMVEHARIMIVWRQLTGGRKDATGLVHSDLLRYALCYV